MSNAYDAIIIGSGIGGLVCGCYLSKAGMKVLIVEQHHKPGGCCTSFKRGGFAFDAAPQCFGSFRKDGVARKILEDFKIGEQLSIRRPDPSDTIIAPDYRISFWNDFEKTIVDFQAAFPGEKGSIEKFFRLLINANPHSYSRLRRLTFKQLLDEHFKNERLKAILSYPFLGIGGLPASSMSAFVGAKIYSEFLLDGGYYPEAGMQALPDALVQRFKESGGEIRLSSLVKKIKVKDHVVSGVFLDDDTFLPSKYIISDCDARQTFIKLIGKDKVEPVFYEAIKNMQPSLSHFILYLGIEPSHAFPQHRTAFTVFSHYDVERAYQAANKGDFDNYGGYVFCIDYNQSTLMAMLPAPFKSKTYWTKNKDRIAQKTIDMIERYSIADLSKHIVFRETATPQTINRYTLNYKGASLGWANIPSQVTIPELSKPPRIDRLYLSSHWTTLGIGISGVAYVGMDAARMILRREKKSIN